MAYTGQLYQLESKRQLGHQNYVAVNGPWDSFGVIISSKPSSDGRWLNLIRGVPKRPYDKPKYNF